MRIKVSAILIYTFLIVLLIISFLPFYIMMLNATRPTGEILLGMTVIPGGYLIENAISFFSTEAGNPWRSLFNSMFIAVCATALTMYFSALTAYAFEIYDFKYKKPLFIIVMFSLMIPAQLTLIGYYKVIDVLHLVDSYIPLIIPAIANAGSVLFIRQYIKQGLSLSLVESGRMDGLKEITIFHGIVLPVIKPAVFTMGIFMFIGSWNSYLTPLVTITSSEKETLPLLIAKLSAVATGTVDVGMQYFAILFSLIPIMIVFFIFSKQIISGISTGAVKE